MKITTNELRKVTNIVLDHLENLGQCEVEVDEDFYWNIPAEELYNPYETPTDLNMGQLSDDIDEIRKLISKESPCVGYALVWIASVLRRVGEKSIG